MKTATYLNFNNNAGEVIEAYQSIFNATVELKYLYEEGMAGDETLLGKIFHAELKIGDLNLYLADSGAEPDFSAIKFVVEISDEAEAHRILDKIVQDGKLLSDFEKMPFGPTIALAKDRFGIKWNVVIC